MSRRIDLSLFQGDDSDGEDDLALPPNPPALNDLKAKTFAHGVTKKTKWDLEREAEEKKKREEDEATKRALEEFAQEFAAPSRFGPSGRGSRPTRGFVRAGEESVYNPRGFQQQQQHDTRPPPVTAFRRSPSPPPQPKRKGKRAMDQFLEEIKSNQEARDARFGKGHYRDSLGAGGDRDHEMTNLFVVNLPTSVSEDSLGRLFATVGPVGTVKIMWPRDDEFSAARRPKSSLTGFVSYMTRADAEAAIREFDDYDWNGSVLRVSWSSKQVPIPSRPAYEASPDSRPVKKPRVEPAEQQDPHAALAWFEKVSPERMKFIQAVTDRIKTHGERFKEVLLERERDNPEWAFLFNKELPEYHVFQYCMDDSYHFPDPPRPQFEEDGYASVYSTDSEEEAERPTAKAALGTIARRRFQAMLRCMSGKRVEIARAMEFALKRAEAADEVSDLICQSLRIDSTPVPRKMARLHLISDILHNSASPLPNVWRYRQSFERQLPAIFAHFADVYDRLLVYSGSIAADIFRQQVDAVLTIWERWIVFTADVHDALKQLLHKECTLDEFVSGAYKRVQEEEPVVEQPVFKSAGFKSSFKRIGEAKSDHPAAPASSSARAEPAVPAQSAADVDVDGEEIDVDGEPLAGEVDGEPLADDVDGEPLEDVDGDPLAEDVDGEPLVSDDVDGEPLADDVDGEPLAEDVDGEALDVDGEPIAENLDGEALDDDVDGEAM